MREEALVHTYSGKTVDIINPKESDIEIEDIAHALATSTRANGHYRFPFSIAQHSLLCHELAKNAGMDNETLIKITIHDAAEYLTGDCITLLKQHLFKFKMIEDDIQRVIHSKFCIPQPSATEKNVIKYFDRTAFDIESYHLFNIEQEYNDLYEMYKLKPEHWEDVKFKFIETFNDLYTKVNPK